MTRKKQVLCDLQVLFQILNCQTPEKYFEYRPFLEIGEPFIYKIVLDNKYKSVILMRVILQIERTGGNSMYIKSLALKNYRCYEELQVDFNQEYTVLVGVNGAGKSTILDAVATALGSFIAGFDGIASNGITREDAHRKMFELGSRIDAEEQYPVEISAVCDLNGTEISWTRSLHSHEGRTHISKVKAIMEYGSSLQKSVREGNKNVILPLIAY